MAQPDRSDVHIVSALTGIAVAYIQNAANFVARRVFPTVGVAKQSDKYYVFDKNAWMMDQMKRRGVSQESAGSGYTLSSVAYSADVWALHKDIDDQIRKNSDNPLNPDENATKWLAMMALLRLEIQWVTDYFTTSVWGTDATPGTLWSDYAGSDPIEDVETAKAAILSVTGFMPNKFVLGYDVYRRLRNHPDILDRIKYGGGDGPKVANEQTLARVFDVEEVLVAKAVKATNIENETAAYAFTHGKHALLCYAAPSPGIDVPSAGYVFEWNGVSEGLGESVAISKFRMQQLKSDRVEINSAWDNKVVGTDLGYFFNSCVA